MNKKGQAQIIVTLLIILLVIAIIAIVATLIVNTIQKGTQEATSSLDCLKVQLTIENVEDGNVTISRGPDDIIIEGYRVIIDGSTSTVTGPDIGPLESKKFSDVLILSTSKVEVAPILEGDGPCSITSTAN